MASRITISQPWERPPLAATCILSSRLALTHASLEWDSSRSGRLDDDYVASHPSTKSNLRDDGRRSRELLMRRHESVVRLDGRD